MCVYVCVFTLLCDLLPLFGVGRTAGHFHVVVCPVSCVYVCVCHRPRCVQPAFDPAVHLQIEPPTTVKTLDFKTKAFPYTAETKAAWPVRFHRGGPRAAGVWVCPSACVCLCVCLCWFTGFVNLVSVPVRPSPSPPPFLFCRLCFSSAALRRWCFVIASDVCAGAFSGPGVHGAVSAAVQGRREAHPDRRGAQHAPPARK